MRKLPRPAAWFLWLSFGIALYYLVPVFQEHLRADWRETPVLEIGIAEEMVRGGAYVDVSGRPRPAPMRSRSFVEYEYQVAGKRFFGSWRWQGQPVEPLTVLYDPEASHRSVLKTAPMSAAGRLLGWLWLGIGGLAMLLRLMIPAPAGDPAEDDEAPLASLPDQQERRIFRWLVLTDLVVWVVLWNAPSWSDLEPLGLLLERIDEVFPPLSAGAERFFAESSTLAFGLSVLASLGLLAFWRPARTVYAATWLLWIAYAFLGSATVRHGAEALLSMVGCLLGGAILALSTVGPIARAFGGRGPRFS